MRIVTFGEVMMRLAPPGHAKFSQATHLELDFGGGEANVAMSLAYMGHHASHVTRVPDNFVGKSAVQYLRSHWVHTDDVVYGGDKLGHYFLELGAVHRATEVVYDRVGSAFSKLSPAMIDWEAAFQGADWFHLTAITPAMSKSVSDTTLQAVKKAKELGLQVSCDLTWRNRQWQYGYKPSDIMPELLAHCDVLFSGAWELGVCFPELEGHSTFHQVAPHVMERLPNLSHYADKTRTSVHASHNIIQGHICHGGDTYDSQKLDIQPIVDRVGSGDAFAAGIIHGLMTFGDLDKVVNYGAAACALKHTIEGDVNMVSREQVMALVDGDQSAKIIR